MGEHPQQGVCWDPRPGPPVTPCLDGTQDSGLALITSCWDPQELHRSWGSRSQNVRMRGQDVRSYALVSRVTSEPLPPGKEQLVTREQHPWEFGDAEAESSRRDSGSCGPRGGGSEARTLGTEANVPPWPRRLGDSWGHRQRPSSACPVWETRDRSGPRPPSLSCFSLPFQQLLSR